MAPISKQFVQDIEEYAAHNHVPIVKFEKGQRKDDVMRERLAVFANPQGVVFIGKAQEMMLAMPMPPTTSAIVIEAMATSTPVKMFGDDDEVNLGVVATLEDLGDLVHRGVSVCLVSRARHDRRELVDREDVEGACRRDKGDVIHVEAERRSLVPENADDPEIGAMDPEGLAEGILVAEQLLLDGPPDHHEAAAWTSLWLHLPGVDHQLRLVLLFGPHRACDAPGA
ncbi:MAG: hypothetical protein MUF54_03370 [Polyangiaceae bacterium]|nr:hypothetical protein [Polyangiaceae bacterium]